MKELKLTVLEDQQGWIDRIRRWLPRVAVAVLFFFVGKIPEELQNKLDEIPALNTAFKALTPGRQRDTRFIFLHPNNPKTGSQGLKNICGKFSTERE